MLCSAFYPVEEGLCTRLSPTAGSVLAGSFVPPVPITVPGTGNTSQGILLELLHNLLHAGLVCVPRKAETEMRTWVQVVYLGC